LVSTPKAQKVNLKEEKKRQRPNISKRSEKLMPRKWMDRRQVKSRQSPVKVDTIVNHTRSKSGSRDKYNAGRRA